MKYVWMMLVAMGMLTIGHPAFATGHSNTPTKTGNAEANAFVTASARAMQKQVQGQFQGQVGIVKSQNRNNNALDAEGGTASVVVQGDTVHAPDLSDTVPSMAYTTGNTTARCIVGVGGSVSMAGFGGALTGGVKDDFCVRTWLIDYAERHGDESVRKTLLCGEPMYAAADPSCKAEAKPYEGVSAQPLGGIGG